VWLRCLLWDSTLAGVGLDHKDSDAASFEIHRLKARLTLSNGDLKIVQGVREIFEILDAPNPDVSMLMPESVKY
jgi:hypothetical protein